MAGGADHRICRQFGARRSRQGTDTQCTQIRPGRTADCLDDIVGGILEKTLQPDLGLGNDRKLQKVFRQVFWLPDQSSHRVFPEGLFPLVVTCCGGSPRLQRRARSGIALPRTGFRFVGSAIIAVAAPGGIRPQCAHESTDSWGRPFGQEPAGRAIDRTLNRYLADVQCLPPSPGDHASRQR